MPRDSFLGPERCTIGHQETDLHECPTRGCSRWVQGNYWCEECRKISRKRYLDMCDSRYAIPTIRDGEYKVSQACYGRPLDVWKSTFGQETGFTFDLGVDRSKEPARWRVYAPEKEQEQRARANRAARTTLVRWAKNPISESARSAFLVAASESIQFRRLVKRYGLAGREPMKLDDVAVEERVSEMAVRKSITAAIESLPLLPLAGNSVLRDLSVETAEMAAKVKFVDDNVIADRTRARTHGAEEAFNTAARTEWGALRTMVEVGPGGTYWSSDASKRPSLMDAYTDGWIARFEDLKDAACPFRNRKLRKKWHMGYREAAQELAMRRGEDNAVF